MLPVKCPDGGIGRRARLKIWFSQGSAGSIPVPGTKYQPQNPDPARISGFLFFDLGRFWDGDRVSKSKWVMGGVEILGVYTV